MNVTNSTGEEGVKQCFNKRLKSFSSLLFIWPLLSLEKSPDVLDSETVGPHSSSMLSAEASRQTTLHMDTALHVAPTVSLRKKVRSII